MDVFSISTLMQLLFFQPQTTYSPKGILNAICKLLLIFQIGSLFFSFFLKKGYYKWEEKF